MKTIETLLLAYEKWLLIYATALVLIPVVIPVIISLCTFRVVYMRLCFIGLPMLFAVTIAIITPIWVARIHAHLLTNQFINVLVLSVWFICFCVSAPTGILPGAVACLFAAMAIWFSPFLILYFSLTLPLRYLFRRVNFIKKWNEMDGFSRLIDEPKDVSRQATDSRNSVG